MQRNKDWISGRDGEIRQLNSPRVYGKSEITTDGFCESGSTFIVSTVETGAGSYKARNLEFMRYLGGSHG